MEPKNEICLLELEDGDLTDEALLIWKTPLEEISKMPYLRKKELPWTKGPPTIPKDHYTDFGSRIHKLIEDQLLTLWALDRAGLYALLSDHCYPRDLSNQGGLRLLSLQLAKDPLELRWAAAWMLYKRMGGKLDLEEITEFEIKVDKSIPEEYQKLQEIELDKQYVYATGQMMLKRRVLQQSQDMANFLGIVGLNKLQTDKLLQAARAINTDLKKTKEKLELLKKNQEKMSTLNSNKSLSEEHDQSSKIHLPEWEDQLKKVENSFKVRLEALSAELEASKLTIKDLQEKEKERKEKDLARKFYWIRKKGKKPRPKKPKPHNLPIVEDLEALQDENDSVHSA